MSVDKTIKVWDLRNHKCLQTIAEVRSAKNASVDRVWRPFLACSYLQPSARAA